MGSYAKYQECMHRAREQMKRRKTVNIGKEVMTGMYIYNTTKYLFYYIPNIIIANTTYIMNYFITFYRKIKPNTFI